MKTKVVYTNDLPKRPKKGDVSFVLWFPLSNGNKLEVRMGERGVAHVAGALLAMLDDDKKLEKEALKIMKEIQEEMQNESQRN